MVVHTLNFVFSQLLIDFKGLLTGSLAEREPSARVCPAAASRRAIPRPSSPVPLMSPALKDFAICTPL